MTHTDALGSSRRIGHAVWVERRLFEIVGGWVPGLDDPDATIAAATQSRHHGWRADQLASLLSTYAGRTPAEFVTSPGDGIDQALALVAAAPSTVERLAGLHRSLVPRLLDAYDSILDAANPVADAPVVRLVTMARADLTADRVRGDELLDRLEGATGRDGTTALEARADALVSAAGGLLGPI